MIFAELTNAITAIPDDKFGKAINQESISIGQHVC